MRTMFQMGFGGGNQWMGQPRPQPTLAQAQLSRRQRNDTINGISVALDTVKVLNAFIASGANTPQALGPDRSRFWALSNSIAPLYKTAVAPVLNRLSDPNPPWLAPTQQEAQDIRTWVVGINEMSKIYRRYFPVAAAAPTPESRPYPVAGAIAVVGALAMIWLLPK